MKHMIGKTAFTYTSILGGLLVAAACSSDEAPSDVASTGGAQSTETGGRSSMGSGGRAAGGRAAGGKAGGGASGDASVTDGSSGAGGTTNEAGPDVSAGGRTGTGGAPGTGGTDAGPTDCFTNPITHFEIINACTTAEKVDKSPSLPLNLPDGGLKPLP